MVVVYLQSSIISFVLRLTAQVTLQTVVSSPFPRAPACCRCNDFVFSDTQMYFPSFSYWSVHYMKFWDTLGHQICNIHYKTFLFFISFTSQVFIARNELFKIKIVGFGDQTAAEILQRKKKWQTNSVTELGKREKISIHIHMTKWIDFSWLIWLHKKRECFIYIFVGISDFF